MNDNSKVLNIEVIKRPLCKLNIPKSIIDRIECSTNCEMIKDLWKLTPKELCVHIGLSKQELYLLLDEMERIANNISSKHYLTYIENCRNFLDVYKQYIPE